MKIIKFTSIPMLIIASLTLLFSGCGNAVNTTADNSTAANGVNKSNLAVVVNSNQTTMNATTPVSNAANNANSNKASSTSTPAAKFASEKVKGELQSGKTESVILYVGAETGDYAAYCFVNDSEAGRAILAACKDREQCEVDGEVDGEAACKVPGLEADLSASGRILRIKSVKSFGRKK